MRTTLAAQLPRLGTVEFNWTGYEIPVSFDIVSGVPWVVLPIAGLDSCEKYGNPAESVAAFSWQAGKWTWQPFQKAPRGLKQNLIRSTPFNAARRVDMASKRPLDPNSGVELTKGFIPQHVRWDHACHRINRPPDPGFDRSVKEYLENPRIPLTANVAETKDDVVHLTLEENQALMGAWNRQRIVGCEGKVSHIESIFSTRRSGSSISGTLAAYRVALEGSTPRSIFVPVDPPASRTHVARVACSDSLVYVVMREKGDGLSILAYDLEGNWNNAWRIRIADFHVPDNQWGSVLGFDDRGDRFSILIGEYQHHGGSKGPVVATLGKRSRIEAKKP